MLFFFARSRMRSQTICVANTNTHSNCSWKTTLCHDGKAWMWGYSYRIFGYNLNCNGPHNKEKMNACNGDEKRKCASRSLLEFWFSHTNSSAHTKWMEKKENENILHNSYSNLTAHDIRTHRTLHRLISTFSTHTQ